MKQLRRGLVPLRHRNFALFWIGFAASNTGRWCELTGAVWLVYELTGSPVLLGLLGIARGLPSILLTPIAGVLADRVDQRKLLFATQGCQLIASVCLGLLVASGLVELWHVYLQVAFQASVTSFDWAVRNALFPRLVPRAQLTEAVTLSTTAGRTSQFLGPLIGGLAIAGSGEAAPFMLNAVTYLVLMAAVVGMRGVVPRTVLAGSTFRGELTDGFRQIMGSPILNGLLKLELVSGLLQMNPVMITLVAREVLRVGPEGLGLLLAAPAVGALVGVIGLLALGHSRRKGRFVLMCSVGYAATLILFALSKHYALSVAILALTGLLDSLVTVTRQSIVQLAAPGRMRGRVVANFGMVILGTGPLAQTQSGILAGAIGPPRAVLGAGAALIVVAASIARLNSDLWRFTGDEPLADSVGTPTVQVPEDPPPA